MADHLWTYQMAHTRQMVLFEHHRCSLFQGEDFREDGFESYALQKAVQTHRVRRFVRELHERVHRNSAEIKDE